MTTLRIIRRLLLLAFALCALSAGRTLAQDVRITEFLATNVTDIVDEDLSHQPWIEIWNPTPSSTTSPYGVVTLTGWKLTNGTTTWTFPAVQIMPDDRMVIWASGKNRTTTTSPLHTNFTIPTAGGTLQLLRTDNSVASSIASYPAQVADVSWGRDEWDSATTPTLVGKYTKTTPGARNNFSGVGVAGKVLFDKVSQAFTGSIITSLSLAVADASTVIRYTTDGSVPTPSSSLYSSALTVTTTQMLRARAFKNGLLPGETETVCFLLLDGTTSTFTSTMPMVVLTNFGLGTPPADGDQTGFAWVWEPAIADGLSRFTNLPTLSGRIAMDRRGSSTLNNAKSNLNMEFRKARDNDDTNVPLLGMASGADWVFTGPFDYDRSEIHNPFIYSLSRSIGRYAPDVRLAEVWMDVNGGALNWAGSSSGDYFGIYNVVQKLRRDSNRIDVHKLDTYDNDAVGKTGGFIWKVDRLDTGDTGFSAGGQTMAYYYPKELEIKSPQRDPQRTYLTSYITSFNTALQSGTWNNPTTGYAAWLDVNEAIDHHLLNVWPMNVDGMRLSGYWHKERGGKLIPGPIWDFDRTMFCATDTRTDNPLSWRSTVSDFGTDFFNYTWWNRLFADIDFYQKYIDRWQTLRRGAFSATTINALLDTLNGTMSSAAINRDLARWAKAKRSWTSPFTGTVYAAGQAAEVQRIKDWLQQRANFFDSQWVAPVNFSAAGGNIAPGLTLTLSAASGSTIYYTLDGSDPRPSGGGAPSGGNVFTYSSPLTINSTTRVRARAYNASWTALTGANNPPLASKWSGPTYARFSTDTPANAANLAVTEVNYHPADPTAAELAINPVFDTSAFEFIELKNIGNTPIDLGGVQFTLGITYTFTNDVAFTLAPGAFVVIAANPSAFTARYGAVANVVGPFTGDLANAGEQITLKAANGTTIADFTYLDTWFPTTDGLGRTLAIYNPTAPSAAFSTAVNWRASAALGGSPGANEPNLAPTVSAGGSLIGNLPSIALTGAVDDDTLPSSTLTLGWSKLNGPGTVSFSPSNAASTTATFTLPGVYALRLSVSDTALANASDTTITMRDTPGQWLLRHPGLGTLNDAPAGTGRTNWYQWALVLDPTAANTSDGTTIANESGHLTLTYKRQKNSPFVSYTVQATSDLSAWGNPQPGDITETILADDDITQTVKATDNAAATASRFIRLRVQPLP